MHLRMTLAIGEGKTSEELNQYQTDMSQIKDFLKSKPPLHKQIEEMNANIAKAKTLREKSKDVKNRLKLDIKELNETIEDHIQKIG